MMDKVLRLGIRLKWEVEGDAIVHVQLGWDMKRGETEDRRSGSGSCNWYF